MLWFFSHECLLVIAAIVQLYVIFSSRNLAKIQNFFLSTRLITLFFFFSVFASHGFWNSFSSHKTIQLLLFHRIVEVTLVSMPDQQTQTPPASTSVFCCGADLQLFPNGNKDEDMFEGKVDTAKNEEENGQTSTEKMKAIDEHINYCLRILRLD